MTETMGETFEKAVARNLEGVHFFSTGARPGCEECGLGDVESMDDPRYELAGESYFAWSGCDSCGSNLGGDRHPAHGVLADSEKEAQQADRLIVHFDVCTDCLFYHAYGDIPV